jgi:hypothetical protein
MIFPRAPVWTQVASIFDGLNIAYVYIWLSKKHRIVYVGQTNSARGTLGRARNHVGKLGTLRMRFEGETGERLETAEDLILASYALPQEPEYIGVETSYREAVEYLVQANLVIARGSLSPTFKLISKVRYTDRASSAFIQRYALEIVSDFSTRYPRY